MFRGVVERAEKWEELRPCLDLYAAVSTPVGAFYAPYLAASAIPSTFAEELVDIVWKRTAACRNT
jgi:hypothetical protein